MLAKQLKQINQQLADLNSQRSHYDDLQRAVRIQDDTYRTLAIRYQEVERRGEPQCAEDLRRGRDRRAVAAGEAGSAAPQAGRAGTRCWPGSLLACGAVLSVEAIDDRLRSPHDVAQILRLPVLATFGKDA